MGHEGCRLFPHSVALGVTSAPTHLARLRPLLLSSAKLAEAAAAGRVEAADPDAEAAEELRFLLNGVEPEGEDFKVQAGFAILWLLGTRRGSRNC